MVTVWNAANNAESLAAENTTSDSTSLPVEDAGDFPVPPFKVTVVDQNDREEKEIIEVFEVENNTLKQLKRGVEDTSAVEISQGDYIQNRLTAGTLSDLNENVESHKSETAKLIQIKRDVIIESTNWTEETDYWEYEISDEDVSKDSMVDVNVHKDSMEDAEDFRLQSFCESGSGTVTLYAEEEPTTDITVDYRITNEYGGEE